jgi:L-seryl-tRNA(Ser) seleniumtransferase
MTKQESTMSSPKQDLLRQIPSVESLLQDPQLVKETDGVPRRIVTESLRQATCQMRESMRHGAPPVALQTDIRQAIIADAMARIRAAAGPHYRRAINATGIILHTGLGRAVIPPRAISQIQNELCGYSILQVDIETGERSRRDDRLAWLLNQLSGADDATIVNNNAAATAIVLNTVAAGREVIVSRGQLVEIGGEFRLPDVMAAAGVKLVEVGTTNKTHPRDYQRAITSSTAAILRVHPSNYKIVGFTEEVELAELARIAHAHHLVLIDDLGAGPLIDFSRFGFAYEPTLADSVRSGADLVTCSGDKMIGASQAGLILGRKDLITAVRANPMARMLRPGKLTLAVLEAVLTLFLDESMALDEVPTLRMLRRSLDDLASQADRIAAAIRQQVVYTELAVIDGFSQMGSGSLPGQNLPTKLVAIQSSLISPTDLARDLRRHNPPVVTRIQNDQVLVDPRTLLDGEEQVVINAVIAALDAAKRARGC